MGETLDFDDFMDKVSRVRRWFAGSDLRSKLTSYDRRTRNLYTCLSKGGAELPKPFRPEHFWSKENDPIVYTGYSDDSELMIASELITYVRGLCRRNEETFIETHDASGNLIGGDTMAYSCSIGRGNTNGGIDVAEENEDNIYSRLKQLFNKIHTRTLPAPGNAEIQKENGKLSPKDLLELADSSIVFDWEHWLDCHAMGHFYKFTGHANDGVSVSVELCWGDRHYLPGGFGGFVNPAMRISAEKKFENGGKISLGEHAVIYRDFDNTKVKDPTDRRIVDLYDELQKDVNQMKMRD